MKRPRAILISGAPATGKSTLAAALAPRLGAAVLDLDVATGPLTTLVGNLLGVPELSDPVIAKLTRGPRYDTLFALAADNLRAGVAVILVAPFTVERTVAGWKAVAGRLPRAQLTLVWLHLPADQLAGRLRRRGAARDSGKLRDPDAFAATVGREPPTVPHLALPAAAKTADLVDLVIVHLAHRSLAIDGKA